MKYHLVITDEQGKVLEVISKDLALERRAAEEGIPYLVKVLAGEAMWSITRRIFLHLQRAMLPSEDFSPEEQEELAVECDVYRLKTYAHAEDRPNCAVQGCTEKATHAVDDQLLGTELGSGDMIPISDSSTYTWYLCTKHFQEVVDRTLDVGTDIV